MANTAAIFAGKRTKLLTNEGILRSDGSIGDNDGPINVIKNGHFEVNTKGWNAYQNTPGTAPVTGSGGSPTVSIARITAGQLMGDGSGQLQKDANNRQGEGVSYQFTLPQALRNQALSISFDYQTTANYLGSAPEFVNVYIYDVTNAMVITPTTILLPSALANGTFTTTFTVTTGSIYRLCLHVAGVGVTDWNLTIDNVSVGKNSASNAPVVQLGNRVELLTSEGLLLQDGSVVDNDGPLNCVKNGHFEVNAAGWATYHNTPGASPTTGAGGAATATFARSTASPLLGDASGLLSKPAVDCQGDGVAYNFTLPSGLLGQSCSIDALVQATANYASGDIGVFIYDITNAALIPVSPSLVTGSSRVRGTFTAAANSTSYRLILHIATNNALAYTFKVDNVIVGPASATPISLAAVGSSPNANAASLSGAGVLNLQPADATNPGVITTGTQTIAGAKTLSGAATFNSTTHTVGQASFDGGLIRTEWYGTDPDVGGVSPFMLTATSHRVQNIASVGGVVVNLPSTGILKGDFFTIRQRIANNVQVQASNGDIILNVTYGLATFTAVQNTPTTGAHWDITECLVLSRVLVHGANGLGSAAGNVIRVFSSLDDQSNVITVSQDSVNGWTFTPTVSGMYSISYTEATASVGGTQFGLSKNSAQLTTPIEAITFGNRLICSDTPAVNLFNSVTWVGFLVAGDVIRAHQAGGSDPVNTTAVAFSMHKVW